ncbi:MAG TPA: hypothetical protein VKD69_23205 [Vicinamibacterales bacterium]|nr:hypothetical protein [Vicinamibacterales bacterium]
MRMKKVVRPKKALPKYRTRVADAVRTMSTRTMVIGVLCFLGAAMMIGAATSDVRQDSSAPKPQAHTASAVPAATAPAAAAASELPAVPPPVDAKAPATNVAAVTITGCLERDDETFRLKDTSGDYAPKARSWRSGFLKKGSATVAVVDAPKNVKLPAHVGERVAVTGVLNGREMQVRSLHRVSASCSAKG